MNLNQRFKLLLETRSRQTDITTAIQWARQHAPQQLKRLMGLALKYQNVGESLNALDEVAELGCLYRGVDTTSPIMLVDPTQHRRMAANTGDLYRVVIDAANPNWPQRSSSLVCTTDPYRAGDYGSVVLVIPRDDAQIGCVNQSDMWDTKLQLISEFSEAIVIKLYRTVADILDSDPDYLIVHENLTSPTDTVQTATWWDRQYAEFKDHIVSAFEAQYGKQYRTELRKVLRNCANLADPGPSTRIDHRILGAIIKWMDDDSMTSLISYLAPLCRYEDHKMTLVSPASLASGKGRGECWVSSPCLLIDIDAVPTVLARNAET